MNQPTFKYSYISIVLICIAMTIFACRPDDITPPVIPNDSIPADTTKHDTIPHDTIPADTIPSQPTTPNDTARNLNYLFDIDDLPIITINVSRNNWNQYLTNFDNDPNNGLYVPAAFTLEKGDGSIYHRDSVGLRPRGNTSRRRPEGTGRGSIGYRIGRAPSRGRSSSPETRACGASRSSFRA